MSAENKLKIIDEEVNSILKKVLAGKSALEDKDAPEFCRDFELMLSGIANSKQLENNGEQQKKILDIFEALATGNLANMVSESVDTETYYKFGEYLNQLLEENNSDIITIAQNYLDLFRLSPFLRKIEEKEKWAKLVEQLILKVNLNVSRLFEQRVKKYRAKKIFTVLKGPAEYKFSYEYVNDKINEYSKNLLSLLISIRNPKSKIAFLTENSLNMVLLDLSCLTTGICNVMIPANSVPQHISFILNETEAEVVLVADEQQLSKIKSEKKGLKYLKKAVLLEGTSAEDWVISLYDLPKIKVENIEHEINKIKSSIEMDTLASIMYTSGTTGTPKGIVFSHMNLVYKRFCRAIALPGIGEEDVFLAYLPLFHTFGRYLEMMGAIFWGAEYAFMENPSVETLLSSMKKIQPTIFISIPKKWMQLYEHITQKVDIEFSDEEEIHSEVLKATGGRLKWGLSAAGFLPPDIFLFMQHHGIELMSGFGMTEATGGITMTPPRTYRPNSLGCALPGIELKLADDGELLIRGKYVMEGYYHEDKNITFDKDGWLATGDIMNMDDHGFIEIIDRKKEIYKNIKGETIAPQMIENYFRDFEIIKQVFLVGDHRPYNTLLIYPDSDLTKSKLHDFDSKQKSEYFSSIVVTVNNFLAPFERILDFKIIDRPFSDEMGELTPKGTYKRRVIEKNFAETIEIMYKKTFISVLVDETEVRMPNWFLREKGCLSNDMVAASDGISIPKLKLSLSIVKISEAEKLFQIGSYVYKVETPFLDFQAILINPYFWLGNAKLIEFTTGDIIQWSRKINVSAKLEFHSSLWEGEFDQGEFEDLKHLFKLGEKSLAGLHLAAQQIQSCQTENCLLALEYIDFLLQDSSLPTFKLAQQILMRPTLAKSITIRREMFKVCVKNFKGTEIETLLEIYLGSSTDLLDEETVNYFVISSKGTPNLDAAINVLEQEITSYDESAALSETAIPDLFKLLKAYGSLHPTTYEKIRAILVRFEIMKPKTEISEVAKMTRHDLKNGFREWLGANESVAVDVETGEEYTWKDVIIIEDEVDHADKQLLVNAITNTSVLREAIFLFFGKTIRLSNLLPSGVWVSHLRSFHEKSVYRVSVQSRNHGSFDIVLNLNKKRSKAEIEGELNWLILAGSKFFVEEVVEDFGGYWEQFDLWTGKFVSGETVEKFLRRESRKSDENALTRLFYLWPFFVWNSASVYFHFWKLTGKDMVLNDPSISNFIIPSHDYQTGSNIVSFSERKDFESLSKLFLEFWKQFVELGEETFPFLKRESTWKYILSGFFSTQTESEGLNYLKQLKEELSVNSEDEKIRGIIGRLDDFTESIEKEGFIPKQLYFAIKRFHRWYSLNKQASLSAQAVMMNDLYETYQLNQLEQQYPETRTKFFYKTGFDDSSNEVKELLLDITNKLRHNEISHEEELKLISNIKTELELSDKEEYFITRLSFPHLKPSDSAVLEKVKSEGTSITNLVVQFNDYDGIPFLIRKPVSPKEISKLHQLFIETNLLVNFREEHEYLVALSERGFIIGGLFYLRTDENTVHMDKIVVSNRYRKKGISDRLMNELFNRLKSDQFKYVTTGFFRPEYFYRFGFKIERRYSGLVKDLSEPTDVK